MIEYDRRVGQYRRDGRFVPRSEVLALVDEERARTEIQLQGLVRRYAAGRMTLRQWETEFAIALKYAHIRMAALAAGGTAQLTPRHYGTIGANLRSEYRNHLSLFASKLGNDPTFTLKMAMNRAKLYGQSVAQSFHDSEKVTRILEGRTKAKRLLDPAAEHCRSCPAYATDGYVPIASVVPPGTNCECRGRCRCRVIYAV